MFIIGLKISGKYTEGVKLKDPVRDKGNHVSYAQGDVHFNHFVCFPVLSAFWNLCGASLGSKQLRNYFREYFPFSPPLRFGLPHCHQAPRLRVSLREND